MSERMRLEQAVRENERLLKAVFDILPVGVWIADKSGTHRQQQSGRRAHLVRRPLPPGRRIRRVQGLVGGHRQADRGGRMGAGARHRQRRDLRRASWCASSASTARSRPSSTRLRRCATRTATSRARIVVNEDITALHEAQEKQRASEQLFRTVFDLLPVGLWIADREGRITRGNPAGQRIWQGSRLVGPEQFGEYKGWWVDTGKPIAPEEWGISARDPQGRDLPPRADPHPVLRRLVQDRDQLGRADPLGHRRDHRRRSRSTRTSRPCTRPRSSCARRCATARTSWRWSRTTCAAR